MKRDTKITRFARKLVELSRENGMVAEARVTEVIEALKQVHHPHYPKILKAFLHYIRREITLQTALVSGSTSLSETSLKAIEAHFTKTCNRPVAAVFKQDESLIAGIRIRVGDDVYDASIAGHLQRLVENVH